MRVIDRRVTYTGAVPLDSDFLDPQRNAMVGLAGLAETVLGSGPVIHGLNVVPTTPTSLAVQVNPGQIYTSTALDALAYGSLEADLTHSIVKQGILLDAQRIPIQPPTTPGYSQILLIQANFQEVEGGAVVLPYYNSQNPSQAWAGPQNSGVQQYTRREGRVVIQVKAGTPAPTGQQLWPSADPGWVGLAGVIVSSGQAVILAQHIEKTPGPHRITAKLPALGRAAGVSTKVVRAPAQLTAEDAGLVIVDLGAFSDSIPIYLPNPANMPGVPMRFIFVGRYITPRSNAGYSFARILPIPSNVYEPIPAIADREFFYCGPNDCLEFVSDGVSRWFLSRGHSGQLFISNAAAGQVAPNGVHTGLNFYPPNANHTSEWWSSASPSRIRIGTHGRYRIIAGLNFLNDGGGAGYRELRVVINGTNASYPLPWMVVPAAPGGNNYMTVTGGGMGLLNGDFIELIVFQNSGGPLQIDPLRTFINVEMLSS